MTRITEPDPYLWVLLVKILAYFALVIGSTGALFYLFW